MKSELVSLLSQVRNESGTATPDEKLMSELNGRLERKRREFEDIENRLDVENPKRRVSRGQMTPASVGQAASLLPDDRTALIEFVVAADRTFAFVLTKDARNQESLTSFPIDIREAELGDLVGSYRSRIARGSLDIQGLSGELYGRLLKPAAARLTGKTNLIIVPDGPLWDLPFQSLNDDNGRYLIESFSLSYAPSATALVEMSKQAGPNKRNGNTELLAVGNPFVGKETAERVRQIFMGEKLEPLPEAERLVSALGKMYGSNRSKIYSGNSALEGTIKSEAPRFRILQFATHGILNDDSPMYSHIVLSQNNRSAAEDGLLEAWEMKDLDLKADMVILSACETARGKISNGEGVIGMSWAMFIAGTPTTVASQWKVESSSTTELMLEFHRQLLAKKKVSKAEALRRASRKVMKMPGFQHPSYWAGFVLLGDGS
jgi:CHAT domain-containing protein